MSKKDANPKKDPNPRIPDPRLPKTSSKRHYNNMLLRMDVQIQGNIFVPAKMLAGHLTAFER